MIRRSLLVLVSVVSLAVIGPATASAATVVSAGGNFTVDSVQVRSAVPVGGFECLLSATVTLTFHGTLVGGATGPITVLSKAPCDQPPTAGDAFLARLTFRGTVAGAPTATALVYAGQTAKTGQVTGTMITARPASLLQVQAVAGVGGSYTGDVLSR